MQIASSRIWTRITMFIFYIDNHYTTSSSGIYKHIHIPLWNIHIFHYSKIQIYTLITYNGKTCPLKLSVIWRHQLEHTYSSYVRIRDVALKTCQRRRMIGRSGERGSGISVLAARHDDDDDDDYQSIVILQVIKNLSWSIWYSQDRMQTTCHIFNVMLFTLHIEGWTCFRNDHCHSWPSIPLI